jgi:hypothetical protein
MLVGEVRLERGHRRSGVEALVSALVSGERDHGNGYAWLYLRGLSFAGCDAGLSLCFHHGRLSMASWSVTLPDAVLEGGWPTREAIDQEIAFVRAALAREIGYAPGERRMDFDWGEIWSEFDPKGFLASNGLRYL